MRKHIREELFTAILDGISNYGRNAFEYEHKKLIWLKEHYRVMRGWCPSLGADGALRLDVSKILWIYRGTVKVGRSSFRLSSAESKRIVNAIEVRGMYFSEKAVVRLVKELRRKNA